MKEILVESHRSVECDVLSKNVLVPPQYTKAIGYVIILHANKTMDLIKPHKICNETL